jgi:hypothetical protein
LLYKLTKTKIMSIKQQNKNYKLQVKEGTNNPDTNTQIFDTASIPDKVNSGTLNTFRKSRVAALALAIGAFSGISGMSMEAHAQSAPQAPQGTEQTRPAPQKTEGQSQQPNQSQSTQLNLKSISTTNNLSNSIQAPSSESNSSGSSIEAYADTSGTAGVRIKLSLEGNSNKDAKTLETQMNTIKSLSEVISKSCDGASASLGKEACNELKQELTLVLKKFTIKIKG